MAIKTKTVKRTVKKVSYVSTPETQPLPILTDRLNSSVILEHKKIAGGIGIAIILIVLLVVLFKSIFIAAIVNGEPITRLSVISALEKQGGKATLDSLITKKLIFQEAKKRNISVMQSDIDSETKKITANLQAQGSTLDQALASQGMTISDLNDEIKVQITIDKMVGTGVTVTEKEVNDFVAANKAQMTPGITEAQFREQATQQLKQQMVQAKTQNFIKSLQDKAKIIHFVSY